MAPSSKLSPNERLLRKRLAARMRQRRCRERKRGAVVTTVKEQPTKVEKIETKHCPPSRRSTAPPTHPMHHRPMFRAPVPYPPPYGCPPQLGYHAPPHFRHGPFPPHHVMGHAYHHHQMTRPHYGAPMPPNAPRTVSRCASESSLEHAKVESVDSRDSACSASTHLPKVQSTPADKFKDGASKLAPRKKHLASVEKAAVAAMLSLKSNSSDSDESSAFSVPISRQHALGKNISLCRVAPLPLATRRIG